MRSDIVFDALQTKNRFVLCHEAFKAIRLLHKSNTRIEDTTNDALMRLVGTEQQEGLIRPEDAATPALETTLDAFEVD
jgi:hypothetical protein